MDLKRKKIIIALAVAFGLSWFLPGNIFTVSGAQLNPKFVASIKHFGNTLGSLPISWPTEKKPVATITPSFKLFPTGQIYVAPSVIVQPTQIIYPTPLPSNYLVDEPPVLTTPTAVPLPTIIYNTPMPMPTYQIPTLPQQPTAIPTVPSQANSTMADFGKCLTNKTMVMYSQEGCSSCTQQKKLLAEAYQYVTVINCSADPKPCMAIGLKTTPSWAKNNKLVIPGYATLDYLAQVSGCQLPK